MQLHEALNRGVAHFLSLSRAVDPEHASLQHRCTACIGTWLWSKYTRLFSTFEDGMDSIGVLVHRRLRRTVVNVV